MVRGIGNSRFLTFLAFLGVLLIPAISQAGQTVYMTSCCQGGATVSMIDGMMLTEMGSMSAQNGTTAVTIGPDSMTGYIGLSSSSGNMVEAVDLMNGMMMMSFAAGNGAAAIAIAPDDSAGFIANQNDGSVTVFDPASGMVTAEIPILPGGACLDAGVSPDSSRAYVVCQLSAKGKRSQNVLGVIVNNKLAKSIALPGSKPFPGNNLLALTPDGTRAYIAGISTDTQTGFAAIDLTKDTVLKFFPLPSMSYGLAVHPMFTTTLFSSGSGVLDYINADTGKIFASTSLRSSGKGGVVPYMGGMRVAVASVDDAVVAVVDNTDGQLCAQIPVGARPERVVISANEMMSLSGNTYTTAVHEFDSASGMWMMDLEGGAAPSAVLLSPQASLAYVVDQGIAGSGVGSGVSIMDTSMGQRVSIVPVAGASNGVLRPDQKAFYVGTTKGSISIINTKLQGVRGKISLGAVTGAPALAVSPDSKTLYATYLPSGGGSAMAVIDTATKKVTNTITLASGTLSAAPAVTVSSDGTLAYAALTDDSAVAIVDLVKLQLKQTVSMGSGVYPSCIGIQPGGKIAYVPANTGVIVLDLVSGTVAGTIQISGVPQNVAFNSNGAMAFVSVVNGNAVIIDTAIDKVIQQLSATNTLGVAIAQ